MCGCCRSMYSIRYIRCVLMVVKSYQFFHDIQLHLPPDYPSNWEHKKYGTYHQINQYLVGSHTRKVWNLCSAAGSFHCPGKHGSESRSRQRMLVVWQHDTNIPPPILDSLLHQTLYKQVLPWTSMSVSLFLCSVFLQQQSVVYSILILVPLVTSMAVDLMKSPFLSVFRWCQGHRYVPSQDLMTICIFLTLILSTPRQFITHILSTKYQAEIYQAEFCFTDCSHDWQCPAGQRCDKDQGVCFDGSVYHEFLCQIGKYPIKKLFFGR